MKTEDKGETMLPAAEVFFYIDVPFGAREMGDTGAHSVAGGTSLQVELVHLNERGREAEMNKRIGLQTFQFHASTLSWICSTSSPILPLLLKGVPAEKLSHGGEGGEGVSGLVDTHSSCMQATYRSKRCCFCSSKRWRFSSLERWGCDCAAEEGSMLDEGRGEGRLASRSVMK